MALFLARVTNRNMVIKRYHLGNLGFRSPVQYILSDYLAVDRLIFDPHGRAYHVFPLILFTRLRSIISTFKNLKKTLKPEHVALLSTKNFRKTEHLGNVHITGL